MYVIINGDKNSTHHRETSFNKEFGLEGAVTVMYSSKNSLNSFPKSASDTRTQGKVSEGPAAAGVGAEIVFNETENVDNVNISRCDTRQDGV